MGLIFFNLLDIIKQFYHNKCRPHFKFPQEYSFVIGSKLLKVSYILNILLIFLNRMNIIIILLLSVEVRDRDWEDGESD